MTTSTSISRSSVRARRSFDRPGLLLLVLVGIGELPLLLKFFADLWTRPQYDFYPLILIGAAYLAWDRLHDRPDMRLQGATLSGTFILAAAFLVLVLGDVLLLRYCGAVSAWIALAGCICWIGGLRLLRTLAPSLVLLLTILPPPGRQDETIALNLRQWAVWASGRLLDLLQIPHVSTGTLINIAGHRLGVEDACSGMHSLLAVVAVTLMLGFYWRRPAWRIITLMCCSIVFVVWANVLRIALGAYLIETWKIDILAGSAHELLGLILFMVCIALTASLDQFLVLLRPERSDSPSDVQIAGTAGAIPSNTAGGGRDSSMWHSRLRLWLGNHSRGRLCQMDESRPTGNPRVPGWVGWGIAGAFVILGIFTEIRVASLWPASRVAESATFSLPASVGDWQRVDGSEQVIGRPELLAQHSFIWTYRNGAHSVLVACDYPFPGYHDLAICYRSSGWQVVKSEQSGKADQAGPTGSYRTLEMQRPSPAFAFLIFSLCDEQGRWLGHVDYDVHNPLAFSYQIAKSPQAYQVQVLAQGFNPVDQQEQQQLRQLFLAVRDVFASQLARQAGRGR